MSKKPSKPIKLTSRIKCCVKGCSTRVCTGVPMHGFPNIDRFPELYQHWVDAVRLANDTPSWVPLKSNRVCAFHFESIGGCRFRVPTIFPNMANHVTTSENQSYDDLEDEDPTAGDYEDPIDAYEASIAANYIMPDDDSAVVYDPMDEDSSNYQDIEESYNAILDDVVSSLVTDDNAMEEDNFSHSEVDNAALSDLDDSTAFSGGEDVETQDIIEEEIIYEDNIVDEEGPTVQTDVYSAEQLGLNNEELGDDDYCVVVVRHEPTETKQEFTEEEVLKERKILDKSPPKRGRPKKTFKVERRGRSRKIIVNGESSGSTRDESPSEIQIPNENALKNTETKQEITREEEPKESEILDRSPSKRGRPKKSFNVERRGKPRKVVVNGESSGSTQDESPNDNQIPSENAPKKKKGKPRKELKLGSCESANKLEHDASALSAEVRERLLSEESSRVEISPKKKLGMPGKEPEALSMEESMDEHDTAQSKDIEERLLSGESEADTALNKKLSRPRKEPDPISPGESADDREHDTGLSGGTVENDAIEEEPPEENAKPRSPSKRIKTKNPDEDWEPHKSLTKYKMYQSKHKAKAASLKSLVGPTEFERTPSDSKDKETPSNDLRNDELVPSSEKEFPRKEGEISHRENGVTEDNETSKEHSNSGTKENEVTNPKKARSKIINGVKVDLLVDGEPVKLKACSVNIVKTPVKNKIKRKAADVKDLVEKIQSPQEQSAPSCDFSELETSGGSSELMKALSLKSSREKEIPGGESSLRRSARIRSGPKRKFGAKSWSVVLNPPKKKLKMEKDDATSQSSESVPYDFEDEDDPDVGMSDLEGTETTGSDYESDMSHPSEQRYRKSYSASGVEPNQSRNDKTKPQPKTNRVSRSGQGFWGNYHRSTVTASNWQRVKLGEQATQVGLPGKCDGFVFDVVRDDPWNVGVSCNVFYNYQPQRRKHHYHPIAFKRKSDSAGTSSQKNGVKTQNSSHSKSRIDGKKQMQKSNDLPNLNTPQIPMPSRSKGGSEELTEVDNTAARANDGLCDGLDDEEPTNPENLISMDDIKVEPAMENTSSLEQVGGEWQNWDSTNTAELVEVKVEDECCGLGGIISVDHGPAMVSSEVSHDGALVSSVRNDLCEPEVIQRNEAVKCLKTISEGCSVEFNAKNSQVGSAGSSTGRVDNAVDSVVASHEQTGSAENSVNLVEDAMDTSDNVASHKDSAGCAGRVNLEDRAMETDDDDDADAGHQVGSTGSLVSQVEDALDSGVPSHHDRTGSATSTKNLLENANVPTRHDQSSYPGRSVTLEENAIGTDDDVANHRDQVSSSRSPLNLVENAVETDAPSHHDQSSYHGSSVDVEENAKGSDEAVANLCVQVGSARSSINLADNVVETDVPSHHGEPGSAGSLVRIEASECLGMPLTSTGAIADRSMPLIDPCSETSRTSPSLPENTVPRSMPLIDTFTDSHCEAEPLLEKNDSVINDFRANQSTGRHKINHWSLDGSQEIGKNAVVPPKSSECPPELNLDHIWKDGENSESASLKPNSKIAAPADSEDAGNAEPPSDSGEAEADMAAECGEALGDPAAESGPGVENMLGPVSDKIPAECRNCSDSLSGKIEGETCGSPNSPDFSSDSSNESFIEVPIPDVDVGASPECNVEVPLTKPPTPEGTLTKPTAYPSFENPSAYDGRASEPAPPDVGNPQEVTFTNSSTSQTSPNEKQLDSERCRSTRDVFDCVERNLEKMFDMER